MSVSLGQVLATARMYLNDDNASVWSDPVLIPKAQEAHRELQTDLWIMGSPVVRNSAQVTLAANANQVASPPGDMLCPTRLTESVPGSGLWFPMTELNNLSDLNAMGNVTTAGTSITYWAFTGEVIRLNPATISKTIEIQYRRLLTIPVINTDLIGILFGELYMAPRIAAMCNGTLGNAEGFKEMSAVAKENFGKVVQANRGQQKPISRP